MHETQFRTQLVRARKTIGWSQYDLAKASGIGRTRLSLFENGHVQLSRDELSVLQSALRSAASMRVSEFQDVLFAGLEAKVTAV